MGFLADLGRSQAVTNTTQALQNLQKNQQAIRMGEQQESLNEMELQKQKVAMQQMAEQDADLNRTVDITTSPAFLSAPPELQKSYLDHAVKGGFVDPSGRGKKRNVLLMQQQMMADEKTFESFAKPRAEAAKTAVIEAYTAYQTLKDKPDADPEKLEKLFAIYKKAYATHLGLTGSIDKVTEGLRAKDDLQKSLETLKTSPEWQIIPPMVQGALATAASQGDKDFFHKAYLEAIKAIGKSKEEKQYHVVPPGGTLTKGTEIIYQNPKQFAPEKQTIILPYGAVPFDTRSKQIIGGPSERFTVEQGKLSLGEQKLELDKAVRMGTLDLNTYRAKMEGLKNEAQLEFDNRKLAVDSKYKEGLITAKGKEAELKQAELDLKKFLGTEEVSIKRDALKVKKEYQDKIAEIDKNFKEGTITEKGKKLGLDQAKNELERELGTRKLDIQERLISEKSETTEQIVKKSLKEQLGREPTYMELNQALKERQRETKENPIAKEAEERRGKILEGSLRREFNNLQEVKDFKIIKPQYENMRKAIEEAKTTKSYVAVDQSLIMLFNKMLDPTSTVRIEEYARTPQDIGMINRIRGKMDKLLSGGAGLTNDERQALMAMGKQFYETYQTLYQGRVKEYNSYMPEGKAITSGEIALDKPSQMLAPKTADDFKKKYGIGGGQ